MAKQVIGEALYPDKDGMNRQNGKAVIVPDELRREVSRNENKEKEDER